jgi:sulfhydrogenase subunit delta
VGPEVEPRRLRFGLARFVPCEGCAGALLEREESVHALIDLEVLRGHGNGSAARRKPLDVALVVGAITTPHDAARVRALRRRAKVLVTLGACATAEGMLALRACAEARGRRAAPCPPPAAVTAIDGASPIAQHVRVDHELRGCPISEVQLLRLLGSLCQSRRPLLPAHSLCVECKRHDLVCVLVARGIPCSGPVTQAGCGARCPAEGRGCEACFGPNDAPNAAAFAELARRLDGNEPEPWPASRSSSGLLQFSGPRP